MSWLEICPLSMLVPERGSAALLPDGSQVALFRLSDERLYALDNLDPFSGSQVLSRGLLGDRDGTATVASPMHKQVFALDSGICLDDAGVAVATYPVRCRSGRVEVRLPVREPVPPAGSPPPSAGRDAGPEPDVSRSAAVGATGPGRDVSRTAAGGSGSAADVSRPAAVGPRSLDAAAVPEPA